MIENFIFYIIYTSLRIISSGSIQVQREEDHLHPDLKDTIHSIELEPINRSIGVPPSEASEHYTGHQ